jgi:predicted XRE-type DNA-binding protein
MSKAARTESVYEELGFPDAPGMLVKAQLVVKIAKILGERGFSQEQAAKIMGLTQPRLSKMLRGQFRGISEAKLMDCLIRLGCEVKIVVRSKRKSTSSRVEVVAA